ncbi:NAD(+)/NADH kinase [Candidatus Woesearchaeota archaeon]|nr:NAD(+)/NADH kinase [Candidatus Woesearchaeota archaeon]
MNITVVFKKSVYQHCLDKYGSVTRKNCYDYDRVCSSHKEQQKTLELVKKLLPDAKVLPSEKVNKPFKEQDLIIAVGGDGTGIKTLHYVKNTPFLLVNSDISASEGALAQCNRFNFEERLNMFKKGKYKIEEWTRLKTTVNGKELPSAINEVFIGAKVAYLTSRYFINGEEHKSSGLIVSTGTGSTAWYSSCGGKPFPKDAKYGKFIAREVYTGALHKPKLIEGKTPVKITSKMFDGIVAIDAIQEFKIERGAKIEIDVSDTPARMVVFK